MNKSITMKRVTVPVTVEVLAKFERFSAASGLSVGKSMGDWLRDTVDGLEVMTDIMETQRRAPMEAMEKLNRLAMTVQQVADGAMQNMKSGPLPGGEGTPLAGRDHDVAKAAIVAAANSPRLVIRGGKSLKTTPKGKG